MHEHSFIQAIIGNIDNRDDVTEIKVEVGELAGIEANHLAQHLIEETGWKVKCEQKDAIVDCECGHTGSPRVLERLHDMVIFDCPKCGEIPKIDVGKDIKILKVVYKD